MVMNARDVIDKLSSYNLFNYLLPGFIFVFILKLTTGFFDWMEYNITVLIFIYFTGLVISRIGSLIIEGILIALDKIKKIDTGELFEAMKDNLRIEIIYEAMNMYRTFSATFFVLMFFTMTDMILRAPAWDRRTIYLLLELALFILFLFAFKKQREKVQDCLKFLRKSKEN
jgi:NADH:ubiquinone oxidoreductase subunit 2 (subunit N)